jgi:hypothetical protein
MSGLMRFITGVRRHALIEALLVAASVIALVFAVNTFLSARDARDAQDRAESQRAVAAEEAAQYNVTALEAELARIKATPLTGEVPSRQDAERRIGELALLVSEDPEVALGPLAQSESSITVANDDIGLDADKPAPRRYDALEVRLRLTGSASALTRFLATVRTNLTDVVVSRVALQRLQDGTYQMEMATVFYHLPREGA